LIVRDLLLRTTALYRSRPQPRGHHTHAGDQPVAGARGGRGGDAGATRREVAEE